ncbi:MAG TPA: class 1 fructose-bisphosphatase, partial [Gemmatimonadaceae bacterium]|nr:class 1 fructose-bisphosphatase [Gemmatimonadaceae bacterium]
AMQYGRTTLSKFIIEEQRQSAERDEQLTALINDIQTSCKYISTAVARGPLQGTLGSNATRNVQGETQQKLDVVANDIMLRSCEWGGQLAGMVSEELPEPYAIPDGYPRGRYLLAFDPLDGSSNIDVNVPVGTIFSVMRKVSRGARGDLSDMLQAGRRQVAAGYVIYGSSTMLVYTTGQGAHGFTLDPSIGEFLLSHPDIKTPTRGRYLSVNDSYEQQWEENTKALIRRYRGLDGKRKPLSGRYVGSLVADFHRNLLGGGLFAYPANSQYRKGKLRLLYEANPLAFICEQAGGGAIDGVNDILDLTPTELHQRTPLYIGSKDEVALARELLAASLSAVGA